MVIDAHQHFWNYSPEQYPWINEEMVKIQKDFTPEVLKDLLDDHNIDGCIAVQANQSPEETSFLMDLSEKFDFIKGVVGWIDLRSEKIEAMLEYSADFSKLKGFRHVVQGEQDINFVLRPAFVRGISCLNKFNFTYDLLIYPYQLGPALELVRKFPNQPFVIDHIAKPYIREGFFDGWAAMMKAIADCPNVYCKVSGLVTEASWTSWEYEDFIPYLDLVFESFGVDRLMFGSDWPVCLLGAEYGAVKNIVDRYMKSSSEIDKLKVFGQNAIRFYNL